MPPRRDPTTRRERAAQVKAATSPTNFSGPSVTRGSSMPAERERDKKAIKEERAFRDFLAATGRSDTNPYGNESSFPFKSANYVQPDVPGGLTREGVATLNRQAFDKFNKPFAERSIFGRDVGGDMLRGKVRSDIRPGTLTRFGMTEAAPSKGGFFSGIANLIPVIGTAMRMNQPAVLPGFNTVPGFNQSKLDQLQRLGPNLGTETSTDMNTFGEIGRGDVEVVSPDSSTLNDLLPDKLAFEQGMGRVPLTYDNIVASGAASDALLDLSNRRNLANTLLSDIDAQAEAKKERDRRALASELAETLGIRAAQRTLGDAPLPVPPPERVTPPVMSPVRANTDQDLAVAAVAPQPLDPRVPDAISLSGSRFLDDNSVTAEMLRDMGVISGASDSDILPDAAISPEVAAPEIQTMNDAAAFERYRDEIQSDPFAADYDDAIAKAMRRVQGNILPPGETLQSYREGLEYLQNVLDREQGV